MPLGPTRRHASLRRIAVATVVLLAAWIVIGTGLGALARAHTSTAAYAVLIGLAAAALGAITWLRSP